MTEEQDIDAPPASPFELEGEPGGPEPATAGSPAERLVDGSAPGPGVPELQGQYGLDHPWAIALRGCCRVATGDGVPPAFEILFGTGLGVYGLTQGDGSGIDGEPGPKVGSWDDDGAE